MTKDNPVAAHYGRRSLFDEIAAALAGVGVDIERAGLKDLTPLDHFHGGGVTATEELADALSVTADHHILDIGCGIGGPARYMAQRFGCRVTGIDLTPEFCDVARRLTEIAGLADRVAIHEGSATDLPFPDAHFDRAYSQNVSMNIADSARLHSEAFRVLRPGGFFALSEIAVADPDATIAYPVPWSADGVHSYLEPAEDTVRSLTDTGFEVLSSKDNSDRTVKFYAAQREKIARDGPPKIGIHIIMGSDFREKQRNSALNITEGRLKPVEILCRKPA
jgi:ubiquinone/menaquinone biosynthesis C-methylase UbiE